MTHLSESTSRLAQALSRSWSKVAPCWPLSHWIAVNPLTGFEDLPFEEALQAGMRTFCHSQLPDPMLQVNRESIKWFQVFFDEGQAVIPMPDREKGLYASVMALLPFDDGLPKARRRWLRQLPEAPQAVILEALKVLNIEPEYWERMLTLMLTTLPGWASWVVYRVKWPGMEDVNHPHPVTLEEYMALRLVWVAVLWPEAKDLLAWQDALSVPEVSGILDVIRRDEKKFQVKLATPIRQAAANVPADPLAQWVFCMDVRSEPIRRALEGRGRYETYGMAGFFGLPVAMKHGLTGQCYGACPVLVKPEHVVVQEPKHPGVCRAGFARKQLLKRLLHTVKYTMTTPLGLVDAVGWGSGIWMVLKTWAPQWTAALRRCWQSWIQPKKKLKPDASTLPFADQVAYAMGALQTIGLTQRFAPWVVICGHGSVSQNNAYASALDCGACGGHHGAPNARLLATILNDQAVRQALVGEGIAIPGRTVFLSAYHNTTTDEITLDDDHVASSALTRMHHDLAWVQNHVAQVRAQTLGGCQDADQPGGCLKIRSQDWAQTRPEWGLARNGALVIGPRWLTAKMDAAGRIFLHDYAWDQDIDGRVLAGLMTGPMVVAQWINAQYLCSTLDPVAFGSGSKVTQNVTGKMGVMQGNASDLMTGLPLQSIYSSDQQPYHHPVRLTVLIHAPRERIDQVIVSHPSLKPMFENGWVHGWCLDPLTDDLYALNRALTWEVLGDRE